MNNIKAYRKHLKLTQQELANKIRVTRPYISALETEAIKSPSLQTAHDLSAALNCKIEDLYPRGGSTNGRAKKRS